MACPAGSQFVLHAASHVGRTFNESKIGWSELTKNKPWFGKTFIITSQEMEQALFLQPQSPH